MCAGHGSVRSSAQVRWRSLEMQTWGLNCPPLPHPTYRICIILPCKRSVLPPALCCCVSCADVAPTADRSSPETIPGQGQALCAPTARTMAATGRVILVLCLIVAVEAFRVGPALLLPRKREHATAAAAAMLRLMFFAAVDQVPLPARSCTRLHARRQLQLSTLEEETAAFKKAALKGSSPSPLLEPPGYEGGPASLSSLWSQIWYNCDALTKRCLGNALDEPK